jgi:photosystem II cytochrome c550
MFTRYIWLVIAIVFLALNTLVDRALAVELSPDIRTVPLNESGETITLSLKQLLRGQRLFEDVCAQCHPKGITKTNQNINLRLDVLSGATPPRDNIVALVDYMKNPTTYDGDVEISELHPATSSADIFPEMRTLSDDDLEAIAGHILVQPKVLGKQWSGGKVHD